MSEPTNRILLICFDALRPDMVTPDLMPNLCAFAKSGVRYLNSRSTFPTETRVNQSAVITGCYPTGHGIVGNKFIDPTAAPDGLFNTGNEDVLREGDQRLDGKLLHVPSLGELMDQAGKRLAVISAGTPGGTRILHHRAEQLGGFRLSLHRPDASVPKHDIQAIEALLGPIPKHEIPSNSWITYATNAYLDYVEPQLKPDVMVLWFCEPDNSYHYKGLGSPENLDAISHVDTAFGRILDRLEKQGLRDELDIITLSDHGQISVDGAALDLRAQLTAAGFNVGDTVNPNSDTVGDIALALDSAGGIYVRDHKPELIQDLVHWLQKQPWCGPIFTDDTAGTLSKKLIGQDHPRAADICLCLAAVDDTNPFGIDGKTQQDAHYPDGGGLHGGLHRFELSNWLALSGPSIKSNLEFTYPAGLIDVLPTIFQLFTLESPDHFQGRALNEALTWSPHDQHVQTTTDIHEVADPAGRLNKLQISNFGSHYYLDRGWVE